MILTLSLDDKVVAEARKSADDEMPKSAPLRAGVR